MQLLSLRFIQNTVCLACNKRLIYSTNKSNKDFYNIIRNMSSTSNKTTEISTTTTDNKDTVKAAPAVDAAIVAIAQMRSTNNKQENLRLVTECVQRAVSLKASMLFLPECCDFVGTNRKETLELAEPLDGCLMEQYKILAQENSIWLSLGGIHESIADTDKIHNAHVLINSAGKIVSIYRKLHMFDVDTPDMRFRESEVVLPGQKLQPPVITPAGRLGLQICYDMRFAEPSLLLRKAGAQLLTYPSAFAHATGKAHWQILLRARAIETQCYVLAAAQMGWHNKKRLSWGHALAVNPWGEVLANAEQKELEVLAVPIDPKQIEYARSIMPVFEHRRADMYGLAAYNMGEPEARQDYCFADNIIDMRTIFYESAHVFAFTNLRCVVEGHVLVATKRVLPRILGLTCEEMSDLFSSVCRIQRLLEAYYGTTSATVTVQDGAQAGQTVPHVHFHVMPRRVGDFEQNDEVYVQLDDQNKALCERTLEERINEAACYREALKKQPHL